MSRRPIILLLLAAALVAGAAPAWAQGQNNRTPSTANCFTPKEAEAEAEVRTGIRLREILRRCAAIDPAGKAVLEDWYAFDEENGDRIRAAVELRRKAIERIYANSKLSHQHQTDAAVATERPAEVNEGVCKSTYDIVERVKKDKWPGFKYYAKLQQNLLASELPLCRR